MNPIFGILISTLPAIVGAIVLVGVKYGDEIVYNTRKTCRRYTKNIMKIIGYTYSFFNRTQFIIFISALMICLLLGLSVWFHLLLVWNDHIMHEKIHTVYHDITVYKTKNVTVQVNPDDTGAFGGAMIEIKSDNEIKGEDINGKLLKDICPNGVHLIDALMDGKPLIQCNQ